ncbi:MAG: sugar phosphate isomerase/epimerase [Candidatus Latescibacterota bacterium]
MKIGYSTWGMPTVPIEEALEQLARLGYDGVEPTVIPGWATELDTLSAAERRRIRRLFDERGLEMPAVAGHRSLTDSDPARHAEDLRRLHGAVDLCAEWAGPAGPPCLDTTLGGAPDDWEGIRELAVERLGALTDYAARRGVTVAIEPHVSSSLNSVERTLWLLAQIDSPYLKLNFDISHFDVQGIPTATSVAALAPHTAHTHVKDQRGRVPDFEFLIPGEGPFDFVEYLREMDRAGYAGHITAEVSIMVQRRPDYDPLAAAELTYRTLEGAFRQAGLWR